MRARGAWRSALLLAAVLPAAGAAAAVDGDVRLGERTLFVLHEPEADTPAAERARRATAAIDAALADPRCGPEQIEVLAAESGPVVRVCARDVLTVTAADAEREGTAADALAAAWSDALRDELARRKQVLYSRRLLRAAIIGLLLPLGYLLGLGLIRLLFRRIATWGEGVEGEAPARKSRFSLLSGLPMRRALAQAALVVKWSIYALVTYVFAIAFLQQFPASARWAAVLLEPIEDGAGQVAPQAFGLVLRLLAVILLLIATRMALGSLGLFFGQVREGKLRIGPLLSAETAGPAELIARVLVIVVAALLLVLLAPGDSGTVVLGLLALLALAVALGARDAAANLIGGLVILYSRPFRTGQPIRSGSVRGPVIQKTLLHTRIEASDEHEVLVPNAWILRRPLEIIGTPRSLRLRVTLRAPGGPEVASGLFRHAAVEAGCRREDGRVHLVQVHDERLVYEIEWPVTRGTDVAQVRSAFVGSLLVRAPGMQVGIIDVDSLPRRAS